MGSSRVAAKWATAESAAGLRDKLSSRIEKGMKVSEVERILSCSRTTAWRFMQGGRIRNSTLSAATLTLYAKTTLEPKTGASGLNGILRDWRASTLPQDQRRVMYRMLNFITELAIIVFENKNVQPTLLITANGRPSDIRVSFVTKSGIPRLLRIGVLENFALVMKKIEGGVESMQFGASDNILRKILKDGSVRKRGHKAAVR